MRGLLVGATFVLLLSGCFFDPCQRKYLATFEWEQADLYDAFPPEGMYDGISVTWDTREEGYEFERKNAQRFPGNPGFGLHVQESNDTWIQFRYERAASETQVRQDLNETFAMLGLEPPIPAVEGWMPSFSRDMC